MSRVESIDPHAVYLVSDVADVLRADERTVRRAIEDGELRSFLPNGAKRGRRVLGAWVIEWMESEAARADG